jgi:hypothetical protein
LFDTQAFTISVFDSLFVDWASLANPIYDHLAITGEDWSTKDACMIFDGIEYYLFFSAFYFDDGRERSHVVCVKTSDFQTYSAPLFNWDGEADGWIGLCSPNISVINGQYVLTFNSWDSTQAHPNGDKNQLFYVTSTDLNNWGPMTPLANNITDGVRSIDAAVTFFDGNYYLVWKENQDPMVAYGSSLGGNWTLLGEPSGGWFENAEFIRLDNDWHLLVTGSPHAPYLMKMNGDGTQPSHWLDWGTPQLFDIPTESFNTNETANAAFLVDWRLYDGYYYLLYAGRTESSSHAGRGNNKLGLARSTDLINWVVPTP